MIFFRNILHQLRFKVRYTLEKTKGGNREWTILRNWKNRVHKIQNKENIREYRRGNGEWIIQRHGQHWAHKIQNKENVREYRRGNREWIIQTRATLGTKTNNEDTKDWEAN